MTQHIGKCLQTYGNRSPSSLEVQKICADMGGLKPERGECEARAQSAHPSVLKE